MPENTIITIRLKNGIFSKNIHILKSLIIQSKDRTKLIPKTTRLQNFPRSNKMLLLIHNHLESIIKSYYEICFWNLASDTKNQLSKLISKIEKNEREPHIIKLKNSNHEISFFLSDLGKISKKTQALKNIVRHSSLINTNPHIIYKVKIALDLIKTDINLKIGLCLSS